MVDDFTKWHVLSKLNTRSFSMLCAIILICAGAYMCFIDLKATGLIDVKSVFVEGRIQTGSIGLMAIFLGVIIILALNLNKPYSGQEIKIIINGSEVTGKGLSYRKMKELVAIAHHKDKEKEIDKLT